MTQIADMYVAVRLNLETGEFQTQAVKVGETAGTAMSVALESKLKKGISSFGTGILQGMGQQAFRGIESAITEVVNAIPSLIERGKEYGLLVDDIADATGASAESASRLAGSLMALGIPTSGLSSNLRILSKQIVDNEALFRSLGVATRDSGGNLLDTVAILDNVRSRLSGMSDGAEKAAVATKLLGKSALELIDYLNLDNSQAAALGEQLKKMGLIVGEEFRAEAEKAKRETSLLDLAFTGLGVTLQAEVGPIIRGAVAGFTKVIVDNMASIRDAISTVIAAFAGLIGGVLGADLSGITTFVDQVGALGGSDPDSGLLGLKVKAADAEAQIAKNNKTIAEGTRVTGANTSAIDKQIAAVEKKDAAEQKAYEKSIARLTGELDARLGVLDAQERAAQVAKEDLDDAVAIAAAEEEVRKQRAKATTGEYDPAAMREAEARLSGARAAAAERAAQRERDAKRQGIEDAKAYIENLATLERDTDNRKALDKTLHRRQTALEEQLAAAQARGDQEAVALLTQKLEAVKTTEVRNQSKMRSDAQKTELEKTKADLASLKAAIKDSVGGGTSEAVTTAIEENKKLEADLATLRAQMEALYSGASGNDVRHGSGGARPPLGKNGGMSAAMQETYADWKEIGEDMKAIFIGKDGILPAIQSVLDKIRELTTLEPPEWLKALFMQGMNPGWKDPGSMGIHQNDDGSWTVDPPVSGGFGDSGGRAFGGMIAAGTSGWVGELGLERAYSLPGGGTYIQPIASSASGSAGLQPAIIRLEIGGKQLMDYIDANLALRPRR